MKKLILVLEEVRKEIEPEVQKKLALFSTIRKSSNKVWFQELVFCILAANTSSVMASRICAAISVTDFLTLPLDKLKVKMKQNSCRFYNRRSEFIVEARRFKNIKNEVEKFSTVFEARDFLADNIKGISFKEASHFLRNTGHFDFAILDKHVKNILLEYGLISERLHAKSFTRADYLEVERILEKVTVKMGVSQGELDYYLWYMKTGKVLK